MLYRLTFMRVRRLARKTVDAAGRAKISKPAPVTVPGRLTVELRSIVSDWIGPTNAADQPSVKTSFFKKSSKIFAMTSCPCSLITVPQCWISSQPG